MRVRGALLFAAGSAGLTALVLGIVEAGVFLPTAMLLWIAWQGSLALLDPRAAEADGFRTSGAARAAVWWGLAVVPMAICAVVVLAQVGTARLPGNSRVAHPTLWPGERITYHRVAGVGELSRGQLAVFRCRDSDEVLVARVLGLPGEAVRYLAGRVCIGQRCPVTVLFAKATGLPATPTAYVEMLDDRFHVVYDLPVGKGPRHDRGGESVVINLGEDEVAVLPDNRSSAELDGCLGGVSLSTEALLGVPDHILVSANPRRIGLEVH